MDEILTITQQLALSLRQDGWQGYDPYDAMTSPFLRRIHSKWGRIAATQFLRYFPINIRSLLGIRKGHNPKAVGLLIRALSRLHSYTGRDEYLGDLQQLIDLAQRSKVQQGPGFSIGWGYNFGWQSQVFFCREYAPNIQTTIIIAHALYEVIETGVFSISQREVLRELCLSANNYLLTDELLVFEDDRTAILDYFQGAGGVSINVQAQAAWSLLRAYELSGEERCFELADKLLRFVESRQRPDGSWPYGAASCQGFIDNFHTGFILESLHECRNLSPSLVDETVLGKGYRFYLDHFFCADGSVKYYHDRLYPIDAHAIAQALITLCKLATYDQRSNILLNRTLDWTLENFYSGQDFFYQKWPFFTNRIPYLRWVTAWMLYAFSIMLEASSAKDK
jgi:hypothetical protein